MKKFVFIILHYYTIEDTKKCVMSILEKCNNVDIIIVDNASPNGTGKELKKLYKDNNNIKIIINEQNLGFSKANNIGFKYAKNKLKADFIIMCNNDTYLLQNDFTKLIEEEYEKSGFAVLGPQILLLDNQINQVVTEMPTLKHLEKILFRTKLNYIAEVLYVNGIYKSLKNVLKNILVKLKLRKVIEIKNDVNLRYENIILHGCFLIFSKKYIEKFDGLDDRTFFYREEELLALRLKNNNLKSIYSPKIKIFHNEYGATKASSKNNRNKEIFVYKNTIKSTKILIEELKDEQKRS